MININMINIKRQQNSFMPQGQATVAENTAHHQQVYTADGNVIQGKTTLIFLPNTTGQNLLFLLPSTASTSARSLTLLGISASNNGTQQQEMDLTRIHTDTTTYDT